MRIAKPILLVTTPVGVVWGVVEAARFHAGLAALMTLLLGVVGGFVWMTVARIRRERIELTGRDDAARPTGPGASPQAAAPPARHS